MRHCRLEHHKCVCTSHIRTEAGWRTHGGVQAGGWAHARSRGRAVAREGARVARRTECNGTSGEVTLVMTERMAGASCSGSWSVLPKPCLHQAPWKQRMGQQEHGGP